jgi:hypothetical protein
MKKLAILFFAGFTFIANAELRMVKGVVFDTANPNHFTAFESPLEVLGFKGENLLCAEWNPASVSQTTFSQGVNSRRANVQTHAVKKYTGRFFEVVNYPFPNDAKLHEDLKWPTPPAGLMRRTGAEAVPTPGRGLVDYVIYDFGTPYTAPATPVDPVLKATLNNIFSLKSDFLTLSGTAATNLTLSQKMPLLTDLAAAAQGNKPSEAAISALAKDLTDAISGNEKLHNSAPQQKQLATDIHATFNSDHLMSAQKDMICDDMQKILANSGITSDRVASIVSDIKAIAAEVKQSGK